MVEFINSVAGEKRLNSQIDGEPVRYVVGDSYGWYGKSMITQEVSYYLNLKDGEGNSLYKPEDIFVLAASTNSPKTPIITSEQELTRLFPNMLIHTTNTREATKQQKHGKLVLSNFNQSKGLERKVVIIEGFDEGYHKFYAKNEAKHITPAMYVGITRGAERLSVIQSKRNKRLPYIPKSVLYDRSIVEFINKSNIKTTDIINIKNEQEEDMCVEDKASGTHLTNLLR